MMRNAISDALVITKRQLMLLIRVPEVLIFSTIQPVMFVLLFRYVFGGSITSGLPGGYVQFLMPGIFVQTVAFTLAGTASGVAEDMTKGLIDRYRSLPIARSALVFGETPHSISSYSSSWGSLDLLWDGGPTLVFSSYFSRLSFFSHLAIHFHGLAYLLGSRQRTHGLFRT
jgi:hypothetical protein